MYRPDLKLRIYKLRPLGELHQERLPDANLIPKLNSSSERNLQRYSHMSERRRFSRIRINRPTTVSFEGQRGVPTCLVQDITGEGAQLALDGLTVFPLQFDLHFKALSLGRRCRVVWSDKYVVGVEFQSSFKIGQSFH